MIEVKIQKYCGILGGIVLALMLVAAARTVKVSVQEAQARSGPGSFYPLVTLIPEGTSLDVLEEKKSWYRVKYTEKEMWVSENSLSTGEGAREGGRSLDAVSILPGKVSVTASPATLTASIKGFWTRYARGNTANLAELPVEGYDISPKAFETFSSNRARAVSRDDLFRKYKLKSSRKRSNLSYENEHSTGYTIASSVAEGSLVEDKKIIEYVHMVGWYLAEATEQYDTRFILYLLDTDRINAISCPGGYIIMTRGLLQLLENESELAALLAHEMSHVIAGHAMQELADRKESIKADTAFKGLDDETGGSSEVEMDLIGITNRAVSIATSPKLDEQEYEADRMALRYMARSGYDLGALQSLLSRMMTVHEARIDIFDLNYRNHPDFKERLKRITKELGNYKNYSGSKFADSFRENVAF